MAFDFLKKIIGRFRGMFSSSLMRSIADVVKDESLASNRMQEAIREWLELYSGTAPWLSAGDESLGLPAIIAAEVARSVTIEMKTTIAGSQMADYINAQFENVLKDIRPSVEYACAGGGIVFKPYIDGEKIVTEIIRADAFYPFSFDASQKISGAYFLYRKWEGKKIYTRLEKHEVTKTGYVITNKAFVSTVEDALGKECMLDEVAEWAEIQPEVNIENVTSPLFAYFRIPIGNVVDTGSPLGASVYSRAIELIRDADKQYQRLIWEYYGGELAIDAPEDAFKRVRGLPVLPEGKERLYRINNIDTANSSSTAWNAWSPSLRDANYISGLNRILIQIENACHLSRGTLSDPSAVERTGTEMLIMRQRSYALISDIQKSLETAFNDLAYAMYCLAYLYLPIQDGEYTVTCQWDDSLIVDSQAEKQSDIQDVRDGVMAKYEYRMKWYGEDEATAKKKIAEIESTMPSDDELLGFSDEEPSEDEGKVEEGGS